MSCCLHTSYQQPPSLPPPALIWLLPLFPLLPLLLPEFVISGWEKNGVPVHSLCVPGQLLHNSLFLQWLLLQESDESLCIGLREFFGHLGFPRFNKCLCLSSWGLDGSPHSCGKHPMPRTNNSSSLLQKHFQSKGIITLHACQEQVLNVQPAYNKQSNTWLYVFIENIPIFEYLVIYLNILSSGNGTFWKD